MPNQYGGPLSTVDPKSVLQRYLDEESTTQIAESLGVTRSALNYFLLNKAETEWKSVQLVKAIKRKEEAEDDLDSAERTPDMLSLSRARERLKAAQWDLERVCRRIYGQDSPPQGSASVAIQINLRRESATEISATTIENVESST